VEHGRPQKRGGCAAVDAHAWHSAGRTRIKLATRGEVFTHLPPNCKAHNIIMGRTWIDAFGEP
jgi:hypothetical protein